MNSNIIGNSENLVICCETLVWGLLRPYLLTVKVTLTDKMESGEFLHFLHQVMNGNNTAGIFCYSGSSCFESVFQLMTKLFSLQHS